MPLTAIASRSPGAKRGVIVTGVIGVAAALSVATFSSPRFAHALDEGISKGLHGVQTVAAMLAERSPGERPEGALAQLKHKKKAALHERVLPKVRAPTAFEALAGPPPAPLTPPPEAPLYTAVANPTTPVVPVTGGAGGPPVLSNIPLPGGGGGGFTPPVITTTETPVTPPTPVTPVPEPATWAMMILGFALIGRALRREDPAGMKPARH